MICFKTKAFFDGCTLKANDLTKYPNGIGTLEFVAYIKDGIFIALNQSVRISVCHDNTSYSYTPNNDGRYIYYKIALPIFCSLDDEEGVVNVPKGYFIGTSGCKKIICFNDENSLSLSNNGDSVNIIEITDLMTLFTKDDTPFDFYSKEFFSICNLNNCVSKLQKKYILEHADDCGSIKCKKGSDSTKANRDFLFIASYLIDHYIDLCDFDQAEELFNTIQSCGDALCTDKINLNCGCHG